MSAVSVCYHSAATAGVVLLLAAAAAQAGPMPALVSTMLNNAPMAAENRCGYTRLAIDEEGSKLERFDPSSDGDPWVLLAIDDRHPGPRELRRYAEKSEKRAERHHPLAFDLRDMVQERSWSLVSENDDEAVFNFRIRADEDLDESLLDKVLGTLVVDKHRAQPKSIVIEAMEPAFISPVVRIAAYRQALRFEWNDDVGAAALTERVTHRRGRALGVRSLRKDKRVLYSDYVCAVYAEELPPDMPMEN